MTGWGINWGWSAFNKNESQEPVASERLAEFHTHELQHTLEGYAFVSDFSTIGFDVGCLLWQFVELSTCHRHAFAFNGPCTADRSVTAVGLALGDGGDKTQSHCKYELRKATHALHKFIALL